MTSDEKDISSRTHRFADKIAGVAMFCLQHRGKCWRRWDEAKIFKYLIWHALNGTIFVIRKFGDIEGVCIAWSGSADEFLRRDSLREPQFNWGTLPAGEDVMIAEVFGTREICAELHRKAREKWPGARRIFTYRHKNEERPVLIELKPKLLERFYGFNA